MNMIKEIKGRFLEVLERTDDVKSFRFKLENDFGFKAGQFLQVIFNQENRADKELNKYLSFSCSQSHDYLEVTKKISQSAFSQKLLNLKPGDQVLFKGPMGNCVLTGEERKVGFLAGGIGITPVISILEDVVERNEVIDIVLLYSNWTSKDIAFRKQLDEWSRDFDHIKIVHTLVTREATDEHCFEGVIDADLVAQHMSDATERDMFVFGPPGMVNAMKDLCNKLGCDKEKVKAETFMGYE